MGSIRLSMRLAVGMAVLVLALGLYVATLAPGLTWRHDSADGGELAAAAWTLGVAHPPGYPTYLLLARGFAALLPWLEVAYRLNLFSAVASALSVLLLFHILERMLAKLSLAGVSPGVRPAVAGAAALALATSPILWSQATVTEVYTLNILFFAGVLALCFDLFGGPPGVESQESPSPARKDALAWRLRLAALLLGLGLGNHVTIGFLLPVLGWLYLRSAYRRRGLSLQLAACLLLGLGVYLYIPLRAAANPPINWGGANTWEGFLWLVTAAPYREFAFGVGPWEALRRLAAAAGLLVDQFTLVEVAVGFVGAWLLWERWPRLLLASLALGGLHVLYAIGYRTGDSYVYLLPFFALFVLWMGVGWLALGSALLSRLPSPKGWPRMAIGALVVVPLALPLFNLVANYSRLDLSSDVLAQQYATTVFQAVGDGALVLAREDADVFPLWYQREVKAPGSRVMVVAPPLLQYQWYWDQLRQREPGRVPAVDPGAWEARLLALVEANLGAHPVYLTYEEPLLTERYSVVSEGVVYRVSSVTR